MKSRPSTKASDRPDLSTTHPTQPQITPFKYISIFRYAMETLTVNELHDLAFDCTLRCDPTHPPTQPMKPHPLSSRPKTHVHA